MKLNNVGDNKDETHSRHSGRIGSLRYLWLTLLDQGSRDARVADIDLE